MNKDHNSSDQLSQKHGHQKQHFPFTKAAAGVEVPKFPYRDPRHYVDPVADFQKKSQLGYTAQLTLNQPHPHLNNCHSPELPTSHPWFEPSTP